jgi:predicted TPR repeat methyltransferase
LHDHDLRADRRLEYGNMLKARGDLDGAVSLYGETLALAPQWAEAHFALAEVLEQLNRHQDACAHYTDYLRHAETDVLGAEIRLALLGAAPVPAVLPEPYVRTLFDQYAERFDEALVTKLEYRAPYLLRDAVDRARPAQPGGDRVLDLGCGTGLAGEAFRYRASWLAGVDLSPGMVGMAARKAIYDDLREAEAIQALAEQTMRYDIVIAADVLVYMGDLVALFGAVRAALQPDGLFAFSLQRTEADNFVLGRECRYSHHPDYIRQLAEDAGMSVLALDPAVCRLEAGKAVPGMIGVLQRTAATRDDADVVPAISDAAGRPRGH